VYAPAAFKHSVTLIFSFLIIKIILILIILILLIIIIIIIKRKYGYISFTEASVLKELLP